MYFNFKILKICALAIFCFFANIQKPIAQAIPGCDPDKSYEQCCAEDPTNPACPIDGGVVALLAAGVGYGIKRARDTKKNNAAT